MDLGNGLGTSRTPRSSTRPTTGISSGRASTLSAGGEGAVRAAREIRRLPAHLGALGRDAVADPTKRADLKQFFKDQDLYLYTANAFVYGVFKKQVIKEDVYEPDWITPERREYTKQVANLLAELAPEGVNPSIQSAPLGFKPKVTGPDIARPTRPTSWTSSRTW